MMSVPHSGTNFINQLFRDHGWYIDGINVPIRKTNTVFHSHCDANSRTEAAISLSAIMPLIMPLRHPYRVEESWKRRYSKEHIEQNLWRAYEHMLEHLLPHVSCFIPIDARETVRNAAVLELERLVGPLKVDWSRVVKSEAGTFGMQLADADPSERMKDIRNHPLFERFYGD
jgi:hypothetical protein